ncbi:integrase core domain-containing protein [Paracoccus sp. JM45]|uniref:integrase core domain-containing protein n=1 Tax=Paracoccus sp. JM45 TaxID=2283626 RepID=UPI000E6C2AD9|nr:hypothetical protein DWB67_17180 [Paracoccus sp. JM45]
MGCPGSSSQIRARSSPAPISPGCYSAGRLGFRRTGAGDGSTNRAAKYGCVYLNAFETGSKARKGIGAWITCCNAERPHSSHKLLTPGEAYNNHNQHLKAAA